jgi:hypothetical protein
VASNECLKKKTRAYTLVSTGQGLSASEQCGEEKDYNTVKGKGKAVPVL